MKRPLLAPFVPLYAAVASLRGIAYDHRLLFSARLQYPVISIGNLAAGGSGKTPLVIRLAQLLQQRGIIVDVLSRGYGRRSKATMRVAAEGPAEDYGDEPLLIARATGIPVYVGSSRLEAGNLAEQNRSSTTHRAIHLLDDGFQHRQLYRAVDIVLVTARDLKDTLLPAGDLREPLSALHRAGILVIREEEQQIIPELRQRNFRQPVWLVQRKLTLPALKGSVIAFCGIARPEDFLASLQKQNTGFAVAAQIAFPDHHNYKLQDTEKLAELARHHQAIAFLTTEKDLVKLDASLLGTLQQIAPVHIARLQTTLVEEDIVVDNLLSSLGF